MDAISIHSRSERPPLSVRPAETTDMDAVLAVMETANAEYRGVVAAEIYDLYIRTLCDLVTDRESVRVAVAGMGARIVGAVAFIADAGMAGDDRRRRWATLRALAVDPAVRGAGIGQRLVGWCIGQARQHEAPAIYLHSAVFQTTAHRLYERLGFKRAPEHDLDATTGYRDIPPTPGVPRVLAFWKKLG
jgi:predicted N-acetyltransferase YhbS